VLPAEFAIFAHFQSVGIILLVFGCVVVSLFAFGASQNNLIFSHLRHLLDYFGQKTR
jgi:hypothetical protein